MIKERKEKTSIENKKKELQKNGRRVRLNVLLQCYSYQSCNK